MTNTEHANAPRPYVRGTKTAKRATARLVPGDQILGQYRDGVAVQVTPAWAKTDAVVLTVTRRLPVRVGNPVGRGGSRMVHRIFFSGTDAYADMTGQQTWMIVVPPPVCAVCGDQIARLRNDGGAVWNHLTARPPVNHQAAPAVSA